MIAIIESSEPVKRPKAVQKYLSERGAAAAKARWDKTSPKERSKYGKKMAQAKISKSERKSAKWFS